MHINPVRVSFNGFAILSKILSAHCVENIMSIYRFTFAYIWLLPEGIVLHVENQIRTKLNSKLIVCLEAFLEKKKSAEYLLFIRLVVRNTVCFNKVNLKKGIFY